MKADEPLQPGELPLLPMKFEYFRRYQFDVQGRYYRGRGERHRRDARRIRRLQLVSFIIAVVVGGLGLLDNLSLWQPESVHLISPLSKALAQTLDSLKIDGDRAQVALGAAAAAIYGFAAALSLLSLHERNASRYLNTRDNLDLLGEQLKTARDDAVAGRESEVQRFVDQAQAYISSEHQEWVRWRDWPPKPDVRAVYVVVPKG